MAEYWHCNECETLYDSSDGNTDERLCFRCIDKIYNEGGVIDVNEDGNLVKSDRRDPNIRRSSTKHYPDWDMKKKQYIVPPNQRSKK